MKNRIIICILMLVIMPGLVYAESCDYTNDYANIQFTIDESIWEPTELTEDREYIELKWSNPSCGILMYGVTDFYYDLSDEEKEEYSRSEYNYNLITYSDAKTFANNMYGYSDYGIKKYNMKFIHIEGADSYMGVSLNYNRYASLNNGYLVMFQYYGDTNKTCMNQVVDVIETTVPTVNVDNTFNELSGEGRIIILLILTIFCYMAYPFISVKIAGKKYNVESCKKMALWNSVIVGGVFMIMTISSGGVWNVCPAYLYYTINKSLWVSKEKKVSKTKKNIKTKGSSTKQKITICKCGCKVLEQFGKCPKCGRKVDK